MVEYRERMERYRHENPNHPTPEQIARICHEMDPEGTEMKVLDRYGLVRTVMIRSGNELLHERKQDHQPC